MNKHELIFNEVKDDILSPGRVFWQQRSGSEVLISAKGGFLNLEMIKKLLDAGHTVLIEGDGNQVAQIEIVEAYGKFSKSVHIKDKLEARSLIIGLLVKYYLNNPRTQEDMDQLCWKLFSRLDRTEARHFLNRDINFFKRAMSVAGSFTLLAFLMGHYDSEFLVNCYTHTLRNLMKLGPMQLIGPLKNRLEVVRKKPHLENDDKDFVKTILEPGNFKQALLLEKFDGSGILTLKTEDLNDLEMVLCSLNYFYHWDEAYEGVNILLEISEGRFKTNAKVIKLIKRNFDVFRQKSEMAG